jgi:hypothetical protein
MMSEKQTKQTKMMTVNLPVSLFEQFKEECKQDGITMSDAVKSFIQSYLEGDLEAMDIGMIGSDSASKKIEDIIDRKFNDYLGKQIDQGIERHLDTSLDIKIDMILEKKLEDKLDEKIDEKLDRHVEKYLEEDIKQNNLGSNLEKDIDSNLGSNLEKDIETEAAQDESSSEDEPLESSAATAAPLDDEPDDDDAKASVDDEASSAASLEAEEADDDDVPFSEAPSEASTEPSPSSSEPSASSFVPSELYKGLTKDQLFNRLECTSNSFKSSLSLYRNEPEKFKQWSIKKDPENIGWYRCSEDNLFYPSQGRDR